MPDQDSPSIMTLTLLPGDYTISDHEDGTVAINMEGYGSDIEPGSPMLPTRTLHVELPEGALAKKIEVQESQKVEINGSFLVESARPVVHDRPLAPEERARIIEDARRERDLNYRSIYGSDELYPKTPLSFLGNWAGRTCTIARIRYCPFQYRPQSGSLMLHKSLRVTLEYTFQSEKQEFKIDGGLRDVWRVPAVDKYDSKKFPFQLYDTTDRAGYFNFVIIVPNRQAAKAVNNFKTWKERIGHSVAVVELNHIYRKYSGIDQAEQIRNFLIEKFETWKIRYVLLVGDLDLIPTRLLYPDPKTGSIQAPYAADFYYADMRTFNWDLDADKRWGEFAADQFNWLHDVIVGRLPFNRADEIERICDNTVAFEQDTRAWKRKVLFASAFMDRHPTDGAELSERIISDILTPQGWSARTLYEDDGNLVSKYQPDLSLTQAHYVQECGPQQHSLVCLTAHGGPDRMQRVQVTDDGDDFRIDFGQADQITPNFLTSVVYMNGCSTACPVPNYYDAVETGLESLYPFRRSIEHNGRTYLLNGAVAAIGSSAGSDYAVGWTDPSHQKSWSLAYYFHRYLITHGKTVGDAFFDAAVEEADKHGRARGVRVFHLLGDPTLILEGVKCDLTDQRDVLVRRENASRFAACNDGNGDMYIVVVGESPRCTVYKSSDHGQTWSDWRSLDVREAVSSIEMMVNRGAEEDHLLIFCTTYDGQLLLYRIPLTGGAVSTVGIPLQPGASAGLINQVSISHEGFDRRSPIYLVYSFAGETGNGYPRSVAGISDDNGASWRNWTTFDGCALPAIEAGVNSNVYLAAVRPDEPGSPVCLVQSADGGLEWGPWRNLTRGNGCDEHDSLAVAASTHEEVPTVWVAYSCRANEISGSRKEEIGYAYTLDNGQTWTHNQTLATGPGTPIEVQLLSYRARPNPWVNAAYVSCQQGMLAAVQDPTTRIFGRAVSGESGNRWSAARIVNHGPTSSVRPQLIYSPGAPGTGGGVAYVGINGWIYFSAPWI
jgi:hypothetical protein